MSSSTSSSSSSFASYSSSSSLMPEALRQELQNAPPLRASSTLQATVSAAGDVFSASSSSSSSCAATSSKDNKALFTLLLDLPHSLAGNVLSFIGSRDLDSCLLGSKRLSALTVEQVRLNAYKEVEQFIKNAMRNLNESTSGNQKSSLNALLLHLRKPAKTFPSLEQDLEKIKKEILQILATLHEEDLSHIEKTSSDPLLFKEIFKLTRFYREIIKTNEISSSAERFKIVQKMNQSLNKLEGDFSFAWAVVTSISLKDQEDSMLMLFAIQSAALKAGDFPAALKINDSVQHENFRYLGLKKIALAYIQKGKLERAQQIANTLPLPAWKEEVLVEISLAFLLKGDISRAFEIGKTISNIVGPRDDLLRRIFENYIILKELPKAIEVAHEIQNPKIRKELFHSIQIIHPSRYPNS